MRLIDADELIVFEAHVDGAQNGLRFVPAEFIEAAPTIETEPVKRGKWEITEAYPHNVYCSVCHKRFAQTHWAVWEDGSLPRAYCPNCGAKMEEP